MVSIDVVFDEEGSWNWISQDDSSYDFFPYPIEEDHESEAPLEPITPPSSPPHPNEPFSSEGSSKSHGKFKGNLLTGQSVLVKRLSKRSGQGLEE
ncbi:hypothetical protein RJ639_018997 [Escallonia herrerae]|uniref:Uncharacterized protein n=1 Tax=Escallonia herrerae TaxID=1293975 RepID=A0AA89AGI3_9ASTE|nr:hypothetical protein RJ639_018997 [Escallonia herrerae]